jgi:hypothetical protein
MAASVKLGIIQDGQTARMAKLSDLLNDPGKIEGLSREAIPQLRGELAQLDTLLLGRLLTVGKDQDAAEDQLIDISQAARRLGISKDYLYHHHKDFAFTRHMGSKLLFAARGIEQYISQKKRL